jgi:hypothetical protein
MGVHLAGQERHEHIDDQQQGAGALDHLPDLHHVGQRRWPGGDLPILGDGAHRGQAVNAGGIAASSIEARADGVSHPILRGEHHHVTDRAQGVVRPGAAGRNVRGEGDRQGGLTERRVTVEGHQLARR